MFSCGPIGLLVYTLIGCTSTQPTPVKTEAQPSPSWFEALPQDPGHLYAAATARSLDPQIALNKAQLEARGQLAQQLKVHYKSLIQRTMAEMNLMDDTTLADQYSQITEAAVELELQGSRPLKQQLATSGRFQQAYVLMNMPLARTSKRILDEVQQKPRYRKNRALLQQLEADLKPPDSLLR